MSPKRLGDSQVVVQAVTWRVSRLKKMLAAVCLPARSDRVEHADF